MQEGVLDTGYAARLARALPALSARERQVVPRRESGVKAFWQSQNLAAGRIHFARGSQICRGPRAAWRVGRQVLYQLS